MTYWRLCAAVDAEREIGRRRINRITATHSIPHGTPTGYRAHKRTGLVICDPCREAHRVWRRQHEQDNREWREQNRSGT